jgi:hypothetical protein
MKNNAHENINAVISTMKDAKILDTKKVSDKWHTFGELYTQRLYLFSIICNQNQDIAWKSKKHFDEENDPMFNGDFIVGLYTPEGPASYHFKMEFWDLFDVQEIPNAPQYDGYTPQEALERFKSITKQKTK